MNIITEVGSTSENENSLGAFRDCQCHYLQGRYGNTIIDGREKNRWLKSNIDHYYQGFSEQSYSSGEDGWFIEHVRTWKQVFYYTHCDYLC